MSPEDFKREYDLLRYTFAAGKELAVRQAAEALVESRPWSSTANSYVVPFRKHHGYIDVRVQLPSFATGFEAQLLVERQMREQLEAAEKN